MLNLLVLQISKTLVHFYFFNPVCFFFFCIILLLRLGNFCYCIFKVTDCFSSFSFILLLSLSTEFFYFIFCTFNSKILIWFFFIHLFVETSYLFVIFLFLIFVSRIPVIVYWNIFFMTAALTALYFEHLCYLDVGIYWLLFLIQVDIPLVLGITSDFHMIFSHLGYCIIGLWVLNLLFWLASYDTTQKG